MSYTLDASVGYAILLGIGLVMAVAVLFTVKAETKWLGTRKTFEWFSTAGRTVKTGLIATSVVSAWTWAATLLQSSTVAYQYGISGPFWYAAGASIQVLLFGILAIELKRKAPMIHTFPELIHARFGDGAHKVFLVFALMTNTIVTSMLILGGAAVIHALTGIDVYVASFLIPIGVVLYTLFGGLKATFYAEYFNTGFIFVVVLIFVSVVYFMNPEIGGISGMYEKLTEIASIRPVEGNVMGAYLTLASIGALIFGIINIVGNFGTVFVDQSYWQRAIASRPRSVVSGFVIGGLAWFAIPFTLATTLGLAAVAVGMNVSPEQMDSGLVAPLAASRFLGDIGTILILSVLFTAVTAAGSAQLISVSSLVTYDVYRTYIKPSSTGRELLKISRLAVLGFGIGMGILSSLLFVSDVSLQYMYLVMGILIGSAVPPIALTILWKKTNKTASVLSAIIGLVLGVSVWLVASQQITGAISISSTMENIPLLAGNLTSILSSLIIVVVTSLAKPSNFNFDQLRHKILVYDEKTRKKIEREINEKSLKKLYIISKRFGFAFTFVLVVFLPLPLFFSNYIFSETVFYVWIISAVIWSIAAASVVWFLPIIQARHSMAYVFRRFANSGTDDKENANQRVVGNEEYDQKILIAIDGSPASIRCINYANYTLKRSANVKVFIVHVIEWPDETNEFEENTISDMRTQGNQMIQSVAVPTKIKNYERIILVGNPVTKIIDLAKSLDVNTIIAGKKGLDNTSDDLGHIPRELLRLTSKPIILIG